MALAGAGSESENPISEVFKGDPKELTDKFFNESIKNEDMLKAHREKLLAEIAKYEENLRAQVENELHALELKGIIVTEEQRKALQASRLAEEQKSRIQAEIEILKTTSTAAEKERQKEQKHLEKEKALLKLKGAQTKDEKAIAKKEYKDAKKDAKKATKEANKEAGIGLKGGIKEGFKSSFKELGRQIEDGTAVQEAAAKNTETALKSVGKAITEGLNAINNSISAYAKHQTAVNARLQGIPELIKEGNQPYETIADNLNTIAFSPLLNAEELYNNVADLAGQGIATNIEQRAMFATLKDSVATTFDVTSESLKRMIRLQQNDSTAARLGMEAYLTEFLNVYVENTEYLQSTFDNVAASLLEASAMLKYNTGEVAQSLEFEYQVQKWLGALTGVGLSDEAAQNIASAIGQLGSGDVESLSGNNLNNLLLMGANKVGTVSYSDILNNGLSAQGVNDLLYGMVDYMQEIAKTGTNVVKSQLAKTFGISVSDLIAVSNLTDSDTAKLRGESLTYQNMYGELSQQFDQIAGRMSISNILDNLFSNMTYQTGADIAKNPALFALWKVTDLVKNATSGEDINIPFITAFGTGIGLETGVANLMQLALAGGSLIGNIGNIISGVGSVGKGSSLLSAVGVGIKNAALKEVGSGLELGGQRRQSGDDMSSAKVIGNQDGDSYQNAAVNDAKDDAQRELDQKLEEHKDPVVEYLSETVKLEDRLAAITRAITGSDYTETGSSATAPGTPVGESSAVGSNSEQTVAGSDSTNISTSIAGGLSLGLYLGTDEFTTDFKSIVANVAKLVGMPIEQEWNGAAGGSANAVDSENAGMSGTGSNNRIDGLTQYSGNTYRNTLLF